MTTRRKVDEYRLRVATAADVPQIGALYTGLSERSVRARFFSSGMSREALVRAAAITAETISVVAMHGSEIVGEARFLPSNGTRELAITVADQHQGHGLGTRLLGYLRAVARLRGVTSLRAVIQADNTPMMSLVQRLGTAVVSPPDDPDVVVDVASDAYMPDWGPATGRPRVLVEARSLDSRDADALHRAGFDLRWCAGPRTGGPTCPLLTAGRCRLAEQADLIASLLPAGAEACGRVAEHHTQSRPHRVVAASEPEWRRFVADVVTG